jgi:ribonucleoside-triphosphate reductase
MGAVAFSSVDTYLAPFIKEDNLSYDEVKQQLQNFIFSINSNSRGGAEPAFSNITLDLTPPRDLIDENVYLGSGRLDYAYRECQSEMDLFNRAFYELMDKGDAGGRPFAYPIPTYNIHDRFDFENSKNDALWDMAGKFGYPYFANFLNSDMDPEDARSMCCRLRLDLRELEKKNGGLFGAGESTGSIGVVTLNMPRYGYEATTKEELYELIDKNMVFAKDSLEIKRQFLQEHVVDLNLVPAFNTYVGTLGNHFSTIGLVGLNEMCENFLGEDILSDEGKQLTIDVLNFMRERLSDFQEETENLYNLEATPAESTAYRLAKKDREKYADIITQGTTEVPYYTNSCHIPVSKVETIQQVFDHQDDIQVLFTGGTVIHVFLGSPVSGEKAKQIVKTVCEKYRVPYVSLSPVNHYCADHGYISQRTDECPSCGKPVEKYQRITGYLRNVKYFNDGKREEFIDRTQI